MSVLITRNGTVMLEGSKPNGRSPRGLSVHNVAWPWPDTGEDKYVERVDVSMSIHL